MRRLGGLMTAIALGACDIPAIEPNPGASADIARGRDAAIRLGCGACHAMPGVDWPRGRVGPDLNGFGARATIAGRLPNRPDQLAAFVRDAQAALPGSAMPAVQMRDAEARDIAAWLQSLK